MRYIVLLIISLFSTLAYTQEKDTTYVFINPDKKVISVNNCTPWDHFKCIYITGKEVYEDGRNGVRTKHWWRMSYIGQACRDRHGKVFGTIFEGIFAIPHYIGVALGNGIGIMVRVLRGPKKEG